MAPVTDFNYYLFYLAIYNIIVLKCSIFCGGEIMLETTVQLGLEGYLLAFTIGFFLGGFFIWLGAKIAGVGYYSFSSSLLIMFLLILASILSIILFSWSWPLMTGIQQISALFIIREVFTTSYEKAIKVWLFVLIVNSILGFIIKTCLLEFII